MSNKSNKSLWNRIIGRFRSRFLSGLLVLIPIVACIWVIVWIFNVIDNLLQPIIHAITGYNITGLGFIITIALILLVGVIAGNYVGKKIIHFGDYILKRVPLVNQIYSGAKQVVDGFSGSGTINKAAFREVVMVEFPTGGMLTPAFVTNEFIDSEGKKYYSIYVPTSPMPSSGFSGVIAEDKIIRTKLTVDEAFKMVISGLIIVPSSLKLCDDVKNITLMGSTIINKATEDTHEE